MVVKVAPKINSPSHRCMTETQDASVQEVADFETALDSAGYGRFSRSALIACAGAFFTTGIQNCVMSYVLPAAKCELSLTTYQTGLINMAFMSGGVASAFFWGIVGDVLGRRNILSLTLILDSSILLAQSMVNDYRLLLAARCINGFLIGAPSTLVFTYLSDLVGAKKRQFYLNIVGMCFVSAWLLLPAIAWLVIPYKIPDYQTILPVYSWRLFLALGSIPGFLSGLWMLSLPESPRLLADTNRSDKAIKLLAQIHKKNHGKSSEYKIKKLIQENIFVEKILGEENRAKALFLGVLKDLKMLVSKSYAIKSSLIVFVFFANMAAGFGLNLWIPELLLRMQGPDCRTAIHEVLPENARLFNATNIPWKDIGVPHEAFSVENVAEFNSSVFNPHHDVSTQETCNDDMDDDVFISGLIVGACCLLGNAACAVLGARGGGRGVRRAAAACALACALACACLAAFACSCSNSHKIAVAAAAVLNAASLNGNVLLIILLLHALPPKLSGLGVCWGAWWGRSGGVASNLAVGVLLDYSCPAPFIAVAALLTISVGAIMIIKLEDGKPSQDADVDEESQEKTIGLDRYISTHM